MTFFIGLILLFVSCKRRIQPPLPEQGETSSPSLLKPWFQEVAKASGVTFTHTSGHKTRFYMPEIETGGVGLLDYDNDGWLDIYLVNGGSLDPVATNGPGNKLFRNLGNGTFEDVTERAGVASHMGYGMGCSCADYNGDGFTDIYVTKLGPNTLYKNNGDGTFTDVSAEAAVNDTAWSTSAAFFDFDLDGNLDLIVANYLRWSLQTEVECFSRGGQPDYCSPLNYKAPAMDTLYRNKGDGTFQNVTLAAGLDKAYGNGLGVATCDFNHDGLIDIFIANDAMANQLWMNQGHGTFKDEALIRGVAFNSVGTARAGMGVAVVDLNHDSWFDLFVTHLVGEGNGLFMNNKGFFTDTTPPAGPNAKSYPFTGFGVGFVDFDNDGLPDLFVANGRVRNGPANLDAHDPYAEPNSLLKGLPDGRFAEIPNAGLETALLATGRGAAFGDFDNDGKMDVIVVNKDASVHLFRNCVADAGHWIMLKVLNSRNTYAHNAIVRLRLGEKVFFKQVQPNESYFSSNDPRVHFGLGSLTTADEVLIQWPDHTSESFGPLEADKMHTLIEGKGRQQKL